MYLSLQRPTKIEDVRCRPFMVNDIKGKISRHRTHNNVLTCHCIFFYYYLVCEAIGTAATPGLFCQPRVIMNMIVEN
jgi:hypothetical protein